MNDINFIYFDSFWVELIPKGIKKFIGSKDIITNIYRIEAYDLIMCEYFCIGFNGFMLKCKSLLDYAILFSPNEYEKKRFNYTKTFSIITKIFWWIYLNSRLKVKKCWYHLLYTDVISFFAIKKCQKKPQNWWI